MLFRRRKIFVSQKMFKLWYRFSTLKSLDKRNQTFAEPLNPKQINKAIMQEPKKKSTTCLAKWKEKYLCSPTRMGAKLGIPVSKLRVFLFILLLSSRSFFFN